MRKLILFSILFLIPFSAFADDEIYRVERPDGGVSIIYYRVGAKDSLYDVIQSFGFSGFPIKRINASDIPPKTDRDFWMVDPVTKKIVVNEDAKKEKEDQIQADEDQKKEVLSKLKITQSELDTLVS